MAYTLDGQFLVIVYPLWDGRAFFSNLEIYDGATGDQVTTIRGAAMTPESDDAVHHIEPYLSPDGTRLALVRFQFSRFPPHPWAAEAVFDRTVSGVPGPAKTAIRDMSYQHGVEVIQLPTRTALGMVELPSMAGRLANSEHLAWHSDSSGFNLFSRSFAPSHEFSVTISDVRVEGHAVQRASATTVLEAGDTDGVFEGPYRMPQRLTPSGTELVRYRAGSLTWCSVAPFAFVRSLPLSLPSGFGKHPPLDIPLFSRDASRVTLVNPATGELRSIDTATGSVLRSAQLPLRPGQGQQPREPFNLSRTRNAASLSPDGRTIYVADNRGIAGGVWVLDADTLKSSELLFEGHSISAVVAAADNTVAFALSRIERRIHTSAGSNQPDSEAALDLVRPGSVASGE